MMVANLRLSRVSREGPLGVRPDKELSAGTGGRFAVSEVAEAVATGAAPEYGEGLWLGEFTKSETEGAGFAKAGLGGI